MTRTEAPSPDGNSLTTGPRAAAAPGPTRSIVAAVLSVEDRSGVAPAPLTQPTSTEPGATARMTQLLTAVAETVGGALADPAHTGAASAARAAKLPPRLVSRPFRAVVLADPRSVEMWEILPRMSTPGVRCAGYEGLLEPEG